MNDELQKALAGLIEKSIAVSGDALAFTQEQLPEVIQQLLLWKLTYSALMTLLGVMFFVVLGVLSWRYWRDVLRVLGDEYASLLSRSSVFLLLFFAVPSLVIFAGSLINLEWLQIWLTPKVYLLEYAANLIR